MFKYMIITYSWLSRATCQVAVVDLGVASDFIEAYWDNIPGCKWGEEIDYTYLTQCQYVLPAN